MLGHVQALAGWRNILPLKFSPDINAGAVVQTIAVVLTAITIGVGAYVAQNNAIHTMAENQTAALNTFSQHQAEIIAGITARVAVLESRRTVDDMFQNETKRQLNVIMDRVLQLKAVPGHPYVGDQER